MPEPQPTPAEVYEQFYMPGFFGAWARRLVSRVQPARGQALLDLACGTGAVARTAAPLLGPAGRVVAVDLRPGMIAVARSIPQPDGAPIEWMEGDALAIELDDAQLDHVVCQAGLQFFADRLRALREARRVLRPGGRLTVLVWQALERQGLLRELGAIELRHLAPLGITQDELEVPFSLADPQELRALLEEAGFADVAVEELMGESSFPDADHFVRNVEYGFSAVIPEFANDPARFDQFVEAVSTEARPLVTRYRRGDWIAFPMYANVATARVG